MVTVPILCSRNPPLCHSLCSSASAALNRSFSAAVIITGYFGKTCLFIAVHIQGIWQPVKCHPVIAEQWPVFFLTEKRCLKKSGYEHLRYFALLLFLKQSLPVQKQTTGQPVVQAAPIRVKLTMIGISDIQSCLERIALPLKFNAVILTFPIEIVHIRISCSLESQVAYVR
ncbi:hypothetical protein D3C78_1417510 [compost metagenome]